MRAILTLNDHLDIRQLHNRLCFERTTYTFIVGVGARAKELGELPVFIRDVKARAGVLL